MNNKHLFIEKLRSSGLRLTKQRTEICQVLFGRTKTFHFTIGDLAALLEKNFNRKFSLATIYNTVHSFKEKGYLKEISINTEKSYYDTNTSNHHHFFNESTNELIDLQDNEIGKINLKKTLPKKKIKSVEVLVKIIDSN